MRKCKAACCLLWQTQPNREKERESDSTQSMAVHRPRDEPSSEGQVSECRSQLRLPLSLSLRLSLSLSPSIPLSLSLSGRGLPWAVGDSWQALRHSMGVLGGRGGDSKDWSPVQARVSRFSGLDGTSLWWKRHSQPIVFAHRTRGSWEEEHIQKLHKHPRVNKRKHCAVWQQSAATCWTDKVKLKSNPISDNIKLEVKSIRTSKQLLPAPRPLCSWLHA